MRNHIWMGALLVAITGCEPIRMAPDGQDAMDADQAKQAALRWLEQSGALDGVDDLELIRVDMDELGMAHVRFQQVQGGVPVQGGQIIVHLEPSGEVGVTTDRLRRRLSLDVAPAIDNLLAQDEALMGGRGRGRAASSRLEIVRHEGEEHLAWLVQLEDLEGPTPSRPVVVVDAHTGVELERFDNLQTVRNRRTHTANNGYSLPGTLVRSEGQGPTGDQALDAAHDNAGYTYDYYWNEQGRDSWDGVGASITSTAHYGSSYENAFWDGTQMVYGDGGFYFYPLSLATDVVSHEITHAVTERTAGLIYSGESGGLNEATSDIMGAVVESYSRGWAVDANTWMVGEDITRPALGDALRFMDDPTRDGISIGHYSDYYSGIDVHYSSGIANKAFYLMVSDPALDIQDAANIWFRALSFYMTPSTTFAEAAVATKNAAADLFGAGSAQEDAVNNAWAGVGVVSLDWQTIATESGLSGATGTEFRFQYDAPPGAVAMAFSLAGNNGDADLYVRRGSAPTTTLYDCGSLSSTSNERCEINPAQSGTYHVLVYSYATFSGVDLRVEAAGDLNPTPEVCDDGVDNDGDGAADCADADCAADPSCTSALEVCDDGVDNDGDGSADCDDSDCSSDPACTLSATAGQLLRFEFPIPAGATGLEISISGGTGDADLYVRMNRPVKANKYHCRPLLAGNEETCVFDPINPLAVTAHVALYAFTDFEGVALNVIPRFASGEVCNDGVDNDGDGSADCADTDCASDASCPLSGAAGSERHFSFDTPAGASLVEFSISGGTGDADLYVMHGAEPTTSVYDCAPYLWGNDEVCTFDPADAGTYYVMIHGFDAYDGVMLDMFAL